MKLVTTVIVRTQKKKKNLNLCSGEQNDIVRREPLLCSLSTGLKHSLVSFIVFLDLPFFFFFYSVAAP